MLLTGRRRLEPTTQSTLCLPLGDCSFQGHADPCLTGSIRRWALPLGALQPQGKMVLLPALGSGPCGPQWCCGPRPSRTRSCCPTSPHGCQGSLQSPCCSEGASPAPSQCKPLRGRGGWSSGHHKGGTQRSQPDSLPLPALRPASALTP